MTEWRVIEGDCRERLAELEPESVQTCVTSPPYWGLRDYGVAGQLGLETSVDEYVAALVVVFRDVRRVLREDGTLWLNLGDGYAHGGNGSRDPEQWPKQSRNDHRVEHSKRKPGAGIKPKDLLGLPWLVAFALRADGWWLRAENIWDKPNGMPESAGDRPAKHHEQVFLLSKAARYFYDRHGYREDDCSRPSGNGFAGREYREHTPLSGGAGGPAWQPGAGRNLRSVWRIPVRPFPGAHFATFPREIPERCIPVSTRPDDTVLDPFAGASTTGLVATRLHRSFVGIELNPDYAEMGRRRIRDDAPLLNTVTETATPLDASSPVIAKPESHPAESTEGEKAT